MHCFLPKICPPQFDKSIKDGGGSTDVPFSIFFSNLRSLICQNLEMFPSQQNRILQPIFFANLNNWSAQGGQFPEEKADPKLFQEILVVLPRGHHVTAWNSNSPNNCSERRFRLLVLRRLTFPRLHLLPHLLVDHCRACRRLDHHAGHLDLTELLPGRAGMENSSGSIFSVSKLQKESRIMEKRGREAGSTGRIHGSQLPQVAPTSTNWFSDQLEDFKLIMRLLPMNVNKSL